MKTCQEITIFSGQKRYSVAFKRCVVREIENRVLSEAMARRKYKIEGHSTIARWLLKYSLYQHLGVPKDKNMQNTKTLLDYIEENKQLQKQVERLETKVLCLDTLIEVAEEHYGEKIRKNFDAKRLKK